MIDAGADVNTPSVQAAVNKHADCVKIFIATGADVKPDDRHTKATPLIEATKNGHTECGKLLLDAGADLNCETCC